MIEKFGGKLNECLKKKNVESVDFKALANGMDTTAGAGMGLDIGGGSDKDGIHGAVAAAFTTVKSVDGCCKDKKDGKTDAMKPLEQCLHEIKKDKKPKMCAMIKPCEDKLSAPCKKRCQEIHNALCQCKQEKEIEIAKKLRALGAENEKVGLQELMHTVEPDIDMQWIMKQVDDCYTSTNTTKNPMIELAAKMMTNGTGSGGGMKFEGRTVIIMGDMMAMDAEDTTECQPCP